MIMLSKILSVVADASYMILFLLVGVLMLFAPLDTLRKIFPNISSRKMFILAGIFFILIGVAGVVLLGMDFL